MAGLVSVVPDNIVSNDNLPHLSQDEIAHLINTTGIKNRRIAPPHITASDLGVCAAKELMQRLHWHPEEVDLLVLVTQTPDYLLPANSILIQSRLQLSSSVFCLDINQGCAGYVYGLSVVSALVSSGRFRKALLIAADTITHTIGSHDYSLIPIFSDAASATAIQYDAHANIDAWFCVQSDASKYDAIYIPDGAFRNPTNSKSFEEICLDSHSTRNRLNLHMNGQDVFHFGLKNVAHQVENLLKETSVDPNTIDYWVFHQANKLLNDRISAKLALPQNKVLYSLYDYGNTSCATIPLTICHHYEKFEHVSNRIVLSGFGVGLSWATACLHLQPLICSPIIEYYEC